MNEYSQMVADLAKPGEDIIATLTPIKMHMLHMAVGLAGETGELLEHECSGGGVVDSELIEELGDTEFYFEGLCQSMHITLNTIRLDQAYSYLSATCGDSQSAALCVVAASDMLDLVKKMVIYNKDVDLGVFVNALTKVRVRLDQAYSYYGITQLEALEHNMNKLLKGDNARYKEGKYTDEAAQVRRDKQIQYAIGDRNGAGAYGMWAGPMLDLEQLKQEHDGRSEHSCIIAFDTGKGDEHVIAVWDTELMSWKDYVEPSK